ASAPSWARPRAGHATARSTTATGRRRIGGMTASLRGGLVVHRLAIGPRRCGLERLGKRRVRESAVSGGRMGKRGTDRLYSRKPLRLSRARSESSSGVSGGWAPCLAADSPEATARRDVQPPLTSLEDSLRARLGRT